MPSFVHISSYTHRDLNLFTYGVFKKRYIYNFLSCEEVNCLQKAHTALNMDMAKTLPSLKQPYPCDPVGVPTNNVEI